MNWFSRNLPLIITSLMLIILILCLFLFWRNWIYDLGQWLRQQSSTQKSELDSLHKIALIAVIIFGASLAYLRFFAYGFVLYRADTELSVLVMPQSKLQNSHFLTVKIINRGNFRLRLETLKWEAYDFPAPVVPANSADSKLIGGHPGKGLIQVIDRAETITILFDAREVTAKTVAATAYRVEIKASGRRWFAYAVAGNRPTA